MEMGSSTLHRYNDEHMTFPEQVFNKMTTQRNRNDGTRAAIQFEFILLCARITLIQRKLGV